MKHLKPKENILLAMHKKKKKKKSLLSYIGRGLVRRTIGDNCQIFFFIVSIKTYKTCRQTG